MSKFSHWTIAFLLDVALLATMEVSAMTQIVDGLEWTYTVLNGEATIGDGVGRAIPSSTQGAVAVPSSLGGYRVTKIEQHAFDACAIESVTIPTGVTSIDNYAFYNCTGLVSVNIPDGIANIKESTFEGCLNLRSVTIPDSVTNIGRDAFRSCWSLNCVVLPARLSIIGYGAFSGCRGLKSLALPESLSSIGGYAFADCYQLSSVTIPTGITCIENMVFARCSELTSVTIPNSVTNIKHGAFYNCSLLTSVTIPNSVRIVGESAFSGCEGLFDRTTIPGVRLVDGWAVGYESSCSPSLDLTGCRGIADYAFYNCGVLTSATISDEVASIGNYGFYGCTGLTSVAISDSVTFIGDLAFYSCKRLTSLRIPNSVISIGAQAFYNCIGIESLQIPNSVVSIGDRAFRYCSSLSSVTIPDSVTSIGISAFSACSSLSSVTIPNSVACISESSFSGCTNLTSVMIPDSVKNICKSAFSGCIGLLSITIPNSVTNIESQAFYGCNSLSSVTIPNSVKNIDREAFSRCFSLTSVAIPGHFRMSSTFPSSYRNVTNVVIASGSTSIISSVFSGCDNIASVTLPYSVTSIENGAFYGCSSLVALTIPDALTSIGDGAFLYCSNLSSIKIPNGVISIGAQAFNGCASITTITIPSTVKSIGQFVFNGCTSLTSVVIENGVSSIPSFAFADCINLKSITIPDSLINIGEQAFMGCNSLLETSCFPGVRLVDGWVVGYYDSPCGHLDLSGCRGICEAAFSGCEDITSVMIPTSVTGIGKNAFECCSNLRTIYLPTCFREATLNLGLPAICAVKFYVPSGKITDEDNLVFISLGNADWCEAEEDGLSFIHSGAIEKNETSSIEVEVFGPGRIMFDWCVSGNRGDYFRVYVDGSEKDSITRTPTWATKTIAIPDGEHIVRWSYERGSLSAAGEDAAFLDNVDWQPLTLKAALNEPKIDWTTDGDELWSPQLTISRDGVAAAQSGPVIGDDVSGLETTLVGPGTLSWSWQLDSAGNAGVDVILDGEWLPSYEPTGEWTEETLEIGEGEHTVRFEFWNAGTAATIADCAYIDQVSWTPTTPQTVPIGEVEVPTEWLSNEASTILSANGGNYETAANAIAANGINKVWECYVAGISPTNAAARFEAWIDFVDGHPVVKWDPDLNEGGTKQERVYKVEGKENLTDSWAPANSASRFFRVKVSMP